MEVRAQGESMDTPEDQITPEEMAFLRRLLREPEDVILPYVDELPSEEACTALRALLPILLRHYGRLLRALRADQIPLT
jgi:hypothetical protein